ncbi:hypothetical protein CkaCkLH20_01559 [Colletotrichum karsti]|uniref:Carboxylic ester hydrolase n=1 Tax=Colletotrichum karsti TaxID=1095194 RepID=A0A9P6LQA6_9PEZI|nr:uncharacterized protein CkaCkLH20_01559 [Colletotrichum karsti]KAF9880517.1 hypothetical protein CkaCkLH20_01559 [Colletotrichum karsti]
MAAHRLAVAFFAFVAVSHGTPTVQIRNGTYRGVFNLDFEQDFFLVMPFAQTPVGDLRLRIPQSLNTSWTGTRNADAYSSAYIGYSSPGNELVPEEQMSEDCLTINVIRPAGILPNASLPVAVWIHGGVLVEGSSREPSYNLSFIVQKSVEMGYPIIAASMNYRLSAWGFLYGNAMAKEGSDHLGYRDQRLALHWIQENIGAFGGSSQKVTLFGKSAGAWSVGAQLLAHGGRDDGLFRAAVLQSGAPIWAEPDHTFTANNWEPIYQTAAESVKCGNITDTVACLRNVPVQQLSEAFRTSLAALSFDLGHYVDGDFFETSTQVQLSQGAVPRVPILLGTNFDEGVGFGQIGVNTTEQFLDAIQKSQASKAAALEIAAVYPEDPDVGIPASLQHRPSGNLTYLGAQYKRMAAYGGDLMMHAPRRFFARALAAYNHTVYNYHWNVVTGSPEQGANHFAEVPVVFNDVSQFKEHPKFSQFSRHADTMSITCQKWPTYRVNNMKNFVFDVNIDDLVHDEPDDYREAAMRKLTGIMFSITRRLST